MINEDKVLDGLKSCGKLKPGGCLNCPYRTKRGCCDDLKVMLRDAAGVVEAQKKQIEALHAGIVELRDTMEEEARRHGRTVGHEGPG